MFDMRNYIIQNLLNGFEDGTLSTEQINELSKEYLNNGYLEKNDINTINDSIRDIKCELSPEEVATLEYIDMQ